MKKSRIIFIVSFALLLTPVLSFAGALIASLSFGETCILVALYIIDLIICVSSACSILFNWIKDHREKLPDSIPQKLKTPLFAVIILLSGELVTTIIFYYAIIRDSSYPLLSNNTDILSILSIFVPILLERINVLTKLPDDEIPCIDKRGMLSMRNGIIFISHINIRILAFLHALAHQNLIGTFFWGMFACYLCIFIVFIFDRSVAPKRET